MKQLLTLVFCWTTILAFGQLTSSFNYSLSLPQGSMAKNINAIHQGTFSMGYRLPKVLRFVQVGADLGIGGYANLSVPIELQFENSKPTRTNINTKKLTDHSQHVVQPTAQTTDDVSKPLEVRFINVNSNVVHAHKVAEVFTSPLRLLDIKIGYYAAF